MSLLCVELRRDIEFGDPLYAGARPDIEVYTALSQTAIDRIPQSARRKEPCTEGESGINIHGASSSENFNGSYTICGFTRGEFLFSLSQADAEQYLPRLLAELARYH